MREGYFKKTNKKNSVHQIWIFRSLHCALSKRLSYLLTIKCIVCKIFNKKPANH
uniref:Uncharacterized protein n=1 Tax=Anguilla anguilla TaxID=7936 RepID=A0A0E9XM88_ANGAN